MMLLCFWTKMDFWKSARQVVSKLFRSFRQKCAFFLVNSSASGRVRVRSIMLYFCEGLSGDEMPHVSQIQLLHPWMLSAAATSQ